MYHRALPPLKFQFFSLPLSLPHLLGLRFGAHQELQQLIHDCAVLRQKTKPLLTVPHDWRL